MPHLRDRAIHARFKKTLTQTPSISLLGMRQTGKTTLVKLFCQDYLTLDDDRTLYSFQDGNWSSLDSARASTAIDECQKLPGLFDHVKWLIDQKKQMGRFILTGSVRFLSKKQIKESLTGRTLILELLPMTLAESHQKTPYNFIEAVLQAKTFESFVQSRKKSVWCSPSQVQHHLTTGGLPGICFKRDAQLRADLFEQHVETLLSRDLPMLYQTKLRLSKLKLLLTELAQTQGSVFYGEKTARLIGVSAPTLRAIMNALEGLFLLRKIGKTYFLEDGGISNHLAKNDHLTPAQLDQSFVFRELLAILKYRYSRSDEITRYQTRGGVNIPFVFKTRGDVIGITVDATDRVGEKSIKGLGKFRNAARAKRLIAFHRGDHPYLSTTNVWCLPLTWLV